MIYKATFDFFGIFYVLLDKFCGYAILLVLMTSVDIDVIGTHSPLKHLSSPAGLGFGVKVAVLRPQVEVSGAK